jgi:hypothetical protein
MGQLSLTSAKRLGTGRTPGLLETYSGHMLVPGLKGDCPGTARNSH